MTSEEIDSSTFSCKEGYQLDNGESNQSSRRRNMTSEKIDSSTFNCNESYHFDNGVLLKKVSKSTRLFEFILYLLWDPRYSAIIAWEGTSGEFRIIRPDQVARLWGERNGRPNSTYKKFSRLLRYCFDKKVLTKVQGEKFMYKFNLCEVNKEYSFRSIPFPVTSDSRQ